MHFSTFVLCVGVAICTLIAGVRPQGFPGQVPPFRPVSQQNPQFSTNNRRQLTPVQQSHILNDVQQHHHRFAFPPSNQVDNRPKQSFHQKSPNFQVEPSISKQLPTQTTIINQRPPQPPIHHHHPQQQQLPQYNFGHQQVQQSQQNIRSVAAPIDQQQQQHFQHHTQTNFIPNFAQPKPRPPPQQQPQFNSPFSGGPQPTQQLSQQFHQQPLNQRSIQSQFTQQQIPQIQQKPFQPSVQLNEPVLPTPVAIEETSAPQFIFNQAPAQPQRPIQPVLTSQQIQASQFFQGQQQLPQTSQQQFAQQQQHQYTGQQSFVQPQHQQYFTNTREDEERIREKQKIIQKHEQFVQKQYEKQQSRVKQQHEEFLVKQRQIKEQSPSHIYQHQQQQQQQFQFPTTQGRNVQQSIDADAFQRAVKQYQLAHPTIPPPTTTTTTTTTTTQRPAIRQRPTPRSASSKQELSDDDLERFLKLHRQKIYGELKDEADAQKPVGKKTKSIKSTKALGKDDLLKQLKLALAENPQQDLGDKTYDSMDIVLPDGQKVQVIRTTDPKLIEGASPLSPEKLVGTTPSSTAKVSYDDLSSGGLLPNGADYEVIKQSSDGSIQSVGKLPPSGQKKVTFVYLEEQNDGSFKVQGVKANGEKEAHTSGAEVDSIVSRINNGDIKLPPSSKKTGTTVVVASTTVRPDTPSPTTQSNKFFASSTSAYSHGSSPSPTPVVRFGSSLSPYSTVVTREDDTIHLSAAPSTHYPSSTQASVSTFHPNSYPSPSSVYYDNSTPSSAHSPSSPKHDLTVRSSTRAAVSPTPNPLHRFDSSASTAHQSPSSIFQTTQVSSTAAPPTAHFSQGTSHSDDESDTTYNVRREGHSSSTTPFPTTVQITSTTVAEEPPSELSIILKSRGLHAMAKYLRQSGLDSILNETGPYTVFAPTDKAFKNLLVQLGGPERAEEKFKSNPRLLSGLLLHHVIPGSFQIGSLQDEMTGVSLAGTQLRVNQYSLHDTEWNDITITTINGAMVVPEKNDITIPQGIAHAVDRVMFPLPVGDILQTLQSDRERRFTNFLEALSTSGMSELLQNKESGAKTYTVFAPIDAAFANITEEDMNVILKDKDGATKFVMRHISPGTLFSAGMRFYQVRDSLNGPNPITIQKTSAGKIKINEAQILTSNIPTTNGVIHAIDELL